ncbi:hypothetical protein B0H94_102117 [Salsuginibacillus halophilus]|uniref:Uncharacterized protein n=1 Tax=Salsuginibacillus halophilus TaxID=517424 RepID=A0A2P8HX83_9BACI|nr:hypothetical protein [Salsuginibacillus halophilus]PSL50841.1 hypothetical protein B0H94_102117 [Salsuginibacillus halophilus]
MEQVIQAFKQTEAELRIPVLRLEIDYELATLYDALEAEDAVAITTSKDNLQALRTEWLQLQN